MTKGALPGYQQIREQQRANDVNFADAYWLPQLPDGRDELYERLVEAEQTFGPTRKMDSYLEGTAKADDDLLSIPGETVLFTADHATTRWRLKDADSPDLGRKRQGADHGTGGLGIIMAEDTGSALVAPLGRQTMDANSDIQHPLKDAIEPTLSRGDVAAFFSLHRMFSGRVAQLADMRGFNVIIGIGHNPSDETLVSVENIVDMAKTYDLRVGVNQPVINYEADGFTPKRRDDETIDTLTFAASKPGTTRAFAQRTAEQQGNPLAAFQIELSQANLVLPEDHDRNPGDDKQKVGSYLAYLFLRDCTTLFKGGMV